MKQTARTVALEAIRRVTDEGAYSTIVIPGALGRSRLDERDRAFATELAFGTIRRLPPIDWALDRVASRPVARMSPSARTVLRLGAYQVLFTDGRSTCRRRRDGRARARPRARVRERGAATARLRTARHGPSGDDDGRRRGADRARHRGRCRSWAVCSRATRSNAAARAFATGRALCLRDEHGGDHARRGSSRRCATRGIEAAAGAARPDLLPARGRRPGAAAGLRRGVVRGAGPGLGVRRARPRPAARGSRARRLRGAGRQDRLRGVARRCRRRRGRAPTLHPGGWASSAAGPDGSACTRSCSPRTRPRPPSRPVRPHPRRRSVLGPRLGAASPGAALAQQQAGAEQARSDAGRAASSALIADLLAPGRPARLLGVHLPSSGDRRGRRRDRPPSARPRPR